MQYLSIAELKNDNRIESEIRLPLSGGEWEQTVCLTNETQTLEDGASLCASWCVGYDYRYQDDTQFAARHTATTGAVWANVQNKHAAPGICTISGESLLHLYRATGNEAYLTLLKDISHNLTQFVSTPENPIYASYIWDEKPAHERKMQNRRNAETVLTLSKKSPKSQKQMRSAYGKIFNSVDFDYNGETKPSKSTGNSPSEAVTPRWRTVPIISNS